MLMPLFALELNGLYKWLSKWMTFHNEISLISITKLNIFYKEEIKLKDSLKH